VGLSRCALLTKGFSPQAIKTNACMRLSGLGTEASFPANLGLGAETISPPTSDLVRRLFLREPRAWCGGYFPASLGPD
jgi:hypothetical protein